MLNELDDGRKGGNSVPFHWQLPGGLGLLRGRRTGGGRGTRSFRLRIAQIWQFWGSSARDRFPRGAKLIDRDGVVGGALAPRLAPSRGRKSPCPSRRHVVRGKKMRLRAICAMVGLVKEPKGNPQIPKHASLHAEFSRGGTE